MVALPLTVTASKVQAPNQIETKYVEEVYKNIESYKTPELPPFPKGNPKPIEPPKKAVQAVYVAQKQYVAPVANNELAVWNFLIAQGYTRNQTAGIMGNLQQEHGFQTSGDGLAQWNGGRKARLMAMAEPYSLTTQLSFLVMELKESGLIIPDDLIGATRVFQNSFERCGVCNEPARISYAYAILGRH